MNKKNIAIVIVLALAVSFTVAYFTSTKVETVVRKETLGVTPGNDFQEKITLAGAGLVGKSQTFRNSTTTLCSFYVSATSSIIALMANVTTGTTTAPTLLEWGKSLNPDATTTSLGKATLSSAQVGTFYGSSTSGVNISTATTGNFDDTGIIYGGTYLTLKYGNSQCTTGATCTALNGRCSALLLEE